jgi:hypothetical protein
VRIVDHLGNAFTIPAGKDAVVQFAGALPHGLEEGCQR